MQAHKLNSSTHPRWMDTTILSTRSGGSSNSNEKVDTLQLINEVADKTADVFIAELQRSTAEYRARTTAQLQSVLAAFGLIPTELSRIARSAAADAARVRQARKGNEIVDEVIFSGVVSQTAAEERARRCLASHVRRIANRSSRLSKEIEALKKAVQAPINFQMPESTEVIEWRAEATQIEEQTKILGKKLDSLRVPSQYHLKRRYDECMALKSELNAVQERLKRFEGLPPSLAEAAQKLEEAKRQLSTLKNEIRKCNASSFGLTR